MNLYRLGSVYVRMDHWKFHEAPQWGWASALGAVLLFAAALWLAGGE